ncbi:MAG TPA: copper resistance protein CopC [Actinocrinis sp.]|nr:copper resistance protein CopC [Actinocrinis sp.]
MSTGLRARPAAAPGRAGSRVRRRLGGALGAALVLLLATAGPAAAHATLQTTTPTEASVLAKAPAQVTATFDEAVGVSPDSLRVFAPDGSRVDDGNTTAAANPDEIVTRLRSGLKDGTYTVAWHVISADSHPVQGAYTFSIGAASDTSVNAATLNTRASTFAGLLYGALRWLGYLSYALLFGGVVFIAAGWPAGGRSRAAGRLLAGGWVGLMAAALGTILMQGVYAGGLPLGRALDSGAVSATLGTRFGQAVLARMLLLALVAPILALTMGRLGGFGRRGRLAFLAGAGVFGLLGAATWAGADHSSTGIQIPLAFIADLLHLVSMGIWLGGLAMLAAVVLRGRSEDPVEADRALAAVRTFSTMAACCVGMLVVSGTYQAWRNVGSWNALFNTDYGRLVVLKIAGVILLVGLGWMARQWIGQTVALLPTADDAAEAGAQAEAEADQADAGGKKSAAATRGRSAGQVSAAAAASASARSSASIGGSSMRHPGRRTARVPDKSSARAAANARALAESRTSLFRSLRRSVALECGIVLLVLVASSILVESEPGRLELQSPTSVSVPFTTGTATGSVLVVVSPATLGLNQIHLYFSDSKGLTYTPAQVTATFTLAAEKIGPLSTTVEADGPGHFVDLPISLGFRGTWTLAITVRSDTFDETTLYIPVPVS